MRDHDTYLHYLLAGPPMLATSAAHFGGGIARPQQNQPRIQADQHNIIVHGLGNRSVLVSKTPLRFEPSEMEIEMRTLRKIGPY